MGWVELGLVSAFGTCMYGRMQTNLLAKHLYANTGRAGQPHGSVCTAFYFITLREKKFVSSSFSPQENLSLLFKHRPASAQLHASLRVFRAPLVLGIAGHN
jgi:hypothetical protein